jgi:hypothetical protein
MSIRVIAGRIEDVVVRDSAGGTVFGLRPRTGRLVFVDLRPDADWPHECLYVLHPDTGTTDPKRPPDTGRALLAEARHPPEDYLEPHLIYIGDGEGI